MLIVRATVQKILPPSMHSCWDTWSNAWMPNGVVPTLAASVVAPFLGGSQHPLLQGALCCMGVMGLNASARGWMQRGRKDWTLPHTAWKNACEKTERSLQGLVHRPHLYRTGALCDLSSALASAQKARLTTDAELAYFLSLDTSKHQDSSEWMDGYTTGNMSVSLLKPEMLDHIHESLGFDHRDIEQWVQASYLYRIHKELPQPLPGTIDAIAKMADANPATMAFYLLQYAAHLDRKKIYQPSYTVAWDNTASSEWFLKTRWPGVVDMAIDMNAKTNESNAPVAIPSATELYRLVMRGNELRDTPTVDGNLFETDGLTA